jgi:hypothetical protein
MARTDIYERALRFAFPVLPLLGQNCGISHFLFSQGKTTPAAQQCCVVARARLAGRDDGPVRVQVGRFADLIDTE